MTLYSPLTWTVVSLAIFALATNIDWLLRSPAKTEDPDPLRGARERAAQPGVRAVFFSAYMAGIPMLALLLKVPTPRQIGLPGPPSAGTARWNLRAWQWPEAPDSYLLSAPWIVLLCVLVSLTLLLANQLWLDASLGNVHGLRPQSVSRENLVALVFFAILFEAHWALFRAGTLSVGLENRSLTMILALGFLALEAWSSPANRHRVNQRAAAAGASVFGIYAILSTTVFYFTGNSFYSFLAHLIVGFTVAAVIGDSTRSSATLSSERSPQTATSTGSKDLKSPGPKKTRGDIEPTIV